MKLSIITINYNNAEGLRKTMESVLSQTYKDFEYVVVDGASTDSSVDIIRASALQAEGLEITWISEPDKGIYNAMNKGIEIALGKRIVNSFNRSELVEDKNKGIQKATGEYLLFLNSGDFLISEDVLKKVFENECAADILNARCNVSDKGKVVWVSPYIPKVTLKDLYFVGLPHQSTFIRFSLFEKYGMYREDFRYNSDIDFWYKTIVLGDATVQGLNLITTDYNLDGLSARDAKTQNYKCEVHEIHSQGFLSKVLPDYEQWNQERAIFAKYSWIEKYNGLQKMLTLCYKILKRCK